MPHSRMELTKIKGKNMLWALLRSGLLAFTFSLTLRWREQLEAMKLLKLHGRERAVPPL